MSLRLSVNPRLAGEAHPFLAEGHTHNFAGMREARNALRSCELRPHSVTAAYAHKQLASLPQTESSSTGRLYSLDEVVADMDGMMDIPGPAADDDEWSDDGYVDVVVASTSAAATSV